MQALPIESRQDCSSADITAYPGEGIYDQLFIHALNGFPEPTVKDLKTQLPAAFSSTIIRFKASR